MIRLRASQISIDLPLEASPIWIQAILQKVLKDDQRQVQQTVDESARTYRMLDKVMHETIEFVDPITGQCISMSAAGCAMAVKLIIRQWMQEDHGGTINEFGELIIDDEE